MERTIRVTGKGKVSLKPDTIRLQIKMERVCTEYEDAISASAKDKALLNQKLEKLGFEAAELKTTYFDIDAVNESYRAKGGEWKNRFLGYKYVHRMKLEFPIEGGLLGKVLYVMAHCQSRPEFSVIHTVADPEAAKNRLLANAVADSKQKAAVLAEAAGVSLGNIFLIDYSWGEIEFVNRPMQRMLMEDSVDCACVNEVGGCYDLDIEAENIDVTDTVTVVWEIA